MRDGALAVATILYSRNCSFYFCVLLCLSEIGHGDWRLLSNCRVGVSGRLEGSRLIIGGINTERVKVVEGGGCVEN